MNIIIKYAKSARKKTGILAKLLKITYQLGVSDTRNVFEKLKIVASEGTPNFELIPIVLKSELGSSKINLGLVIANKIKNN